MDEQILNSVNQKLDRIIEQGRDFIDDKELKKQIETSSNRLKAQVRHYPIASMAAGFAAGFILAKVFSKR